MGKNPYKVALVDKVAVYKRKGLSQYLVDNLKLTLSPRQPFKFHGRRPSVRTLEGLSEALGLSTVDCCPEFTKIGGQRVLAWSQHGVSFQQGLGQVDGVAGRLSQTLDFNPLRMARARLLAAGKRVELSKAAAGHDNYVDPSLVPALEVHTLCLEAIGTCLEVNLSRYLRTLKCLFGLSLAASEVQVTINMVELAWDQPSRVASLAAMIWRPGWFSNLPGAAWHASGFLKAEPKDGSFLKLYPKTDHILRFETQLRGELVRERIGHLPNLLHAHALEADLEAAAAPDFKAMLGVQAGLAGDEFLTIPDALAGLQPPRRREAFKSILMELMTVGHVRSFAGDQQRYRMIDGLRRAGLLRRGEKRGYWLPIGPALPTFLALGRIGMVSAG